MKFNHQTMVDITSIIMFVIVNYKNIILSKSIKDIADELRHSCLTSSELITHVNNKGFRLWISYIKKLKRNII